MLSRIAQEHAREIANHDWSDAPYRADRAGHDRTIDGRGTGKQLEPHEADIIKMNVMWVTAQVLMHEDPNLDITEFAVACGLPRHLTHNKDGRPSGALMAGIRTDNGQVSTPGLWERVS
ncbi:hypothetical protein NCCP1664_17810 [Zafaria cholistanensis]|uniref:Uncharacterized protein n=1 Tax=Zafaria cholistanensis TaxID=1682741 RepID=A0A5A7NRB0_9MICC|nr:hypothetical protein [Zafaria cholistanensis]GER23285.1 hypothetical protein NCCP1664_17810 [Zafaria cholistanensis]